MADKRYQDFTIEADCAPVDPGQFVQTGILEECVEERLENLSTDEEIYLNHNRNDTDQASIISNRESQDSTIISQDQDGDTSLHRHIINREIDAAIRIIPQVAAQNGLNITNSLGQTPLHLAVISGLFEVVRHLVVYGAQVNVCERNGNTALHLACREGEWLCLEALTSPIPGQEQLRQPFIPLNYNILNYEGLSCLHLLVNHKHEDYIQYIEHLVTCGASINMEAGKSGRTILHLAAESNDVKLATYLINNDAVDLIATTWDDQTAYHLCRGRGHLAIMELLEEAGAAKEPINHDDHTSDMDES